MGRPFIFFTDAKSPSPRSDVGAAPSYSTSQCPPQRANTRATLVADAESAALHIIELCGLLNVHYGLARASYTEFSSCRAALLVILAQSLNEQSEALRSALANGMKLIKRMAVSIDSVKSEVSVIEALETAIKRLYMGNGMQNRGNGKQKESGYEKFRNWAVLWKGGQEETGLMGSQTFSPPLNFPETFSWIPSSAQSTGSDSLTDSAAATVDNQLIDFGMTTMSGTFPMPDFGGTPDDDQWGMGFEGFKSLGTGLDFVE
jgi:hypothetical protein